MRNLGGGLTDSQLYDNAMRDRRQLENSIEYLKVLYISLIGGLLSGIFYLILHYGIEKPGALIIIAFVISSILAWQWMQSHSLKNNNLIEIYIFISILEKKYKKKYITSSIKDKERFYKKINFIETICASGIWSISFTLVMLIGGGLLYQYYDAILNYLALNKIT